MTSDIPFRETRRLLALAALDDVPEVRALTDALAQDDGPATVAEQLQEMLAADPTATSAVSSDCDPLAVALRRIADRLASQGDEVGSSPTAETVDHAIDDDLLLLIATKVSSPLQELARDILLKQPSTTAGEEHAAEADVGGPHSIGRYDLLDRIGAGSSGVVYRARHHGTQQLVALKVVRLDALTAEHTARFRKEAHVVAKLSHPGIVRIRDSGVEDNGGLLLPWIATNLIDGLPFSRFAADQPRSIVLTAFAGVCDAMAHAHERGVVHRDLKPENVLVEQNGKPHVVDFGIAKLLDSQDSQQTKSGMLLGTPAYMAPEIASRGSSSASYASDVWALGAILFEALSGQTPHNLSGLSPQQALRRVAEAPTRRIDSLCTVPHDLADIVGMATATEAERRYGSAADLRDDVQRFLADQKVHARRPSLVEDAIRFTRRHRTATIATAIMFALTIAGGVTMTMLWQRAVLAEAEQQQSAEDARMAAAGSFEALVAATRLASELAEQTIGTDRLRSLLKKPLELIELLASPTRRHSNAEAASAWLRLESNVREVVADAAVRVGDWSSAATHRDRVLEIERVLAGSAGYDSRDLARALVKCGDTARGNKQFKTMVTLYQQAHAIYEASHQADPDSPHARDDLSWSLERLIFIEFQEASGDRANAMVLARQRIELARSDSHSRPGFEPLHSLAAAIVRYLEYLDYLAAGRAPEVTLGREAVTAVEAAIQIEPKRRVLHALHVNALRALALEYSLAGDETAAMSTIGEATLTGDRLVVSDASDQTYLIVCALAWRARARLELHWHRSASVSIDRLQALLASQASGSSPITPDFAIEFLTITGAGEGTEKSRK